MAEDKVPTTEKHQLSEDSTCRKNRQVRIEGELDEDTVIRKIRTTAANGKTSQGRDNLARSYEYQREWL